MMYGRKKNFKKSAFICVCTALAFGASVSVQKEKYQVASKISIKVFLQTGLLLY